MVRIIPTSTLSIGNVLDAFGVDGVAFDINDDINDDTNDTDTDTDLKLPLEELRECWNSTLEPNWFNDFSTKGDTK